MGLRPCNRDKERIDTGGETDQYIPRIGWTPDGRLYFFRLNRRQNTFEVILCEPNGAQRTIYDERSQQYVERVDDKTRSRSWTKTASSYGRRDTRATCTSTSTASARVSSRR